MNDFISDEVFKALEGKIDIPDTGYLLEQIDVPSGRYNIEGITLSQGLAMEWVAGDTKTMTNEYGAEYPVRRYGRMRIIHKLFDGE